MTAVGVAENSSKKPIQRMSIQRQKKAIVPSIAVENC
jgi:hypothetical protein